MGTPDRYYAVIEDIKSGKVSAKNLKNKQKAIFYLYFFPPILMHLITICNAIAIIPYYI